jgi:hypothetical protein
MARDSTLRGFPFFYPVNTEVTHLQIQVFAHLTVAKVISAESMCTLLRSFIAVLDEFGVSHGRAKKAALCAGDGLIIVNECAHIFHSSFVFSF